MVFSNANTKRTIISISAAQTASKRQTVLTIEKLSKPTSLLKSLALLLMGMAFFVGGVKGQTSTQNFGTSSSSAYTSSTASTSYIPSPTGSPTPTTFARAGSGGSPSITLTTTIPSPFTGTGAIINASASTSTGVTKVSPIVAYSGATEFYTSFKVLFGNSAGANTATSGTWSFFQGVGANFSDNNIMTNNQTFVGLTFTFGSAGALSLAYFNGGSSSTTGLTTTALAQATDYTIEVVGNNKSSGTINYTYNGVSQTVAVQTFDLYINGTKVGDDLAKNTLASNTSITSITFTGISSTSNAANIFLDNVVTYNAVPASIGVSNTNFYWNGPTTSGTGIATGGAGTWNTSTTNWRNPNNNASDVSIAWTNSTNNIANLTAGTGSISMGTSITAGGLNVSTSGYTLSPSSNITLASPVTLTNSLTVAPATGTTFTMSGIISSSGALTQNGAGTTTLSGTNTYTGINTITSGTLSVAGDANLGAAPGSATANSISLNGGTLATTSTLTTTANRGITLNTSTSSTIDVASGTTLTVNGIIAGSGNLTKTSTGILTFSGANTNSGTLTINDGTIKASAASRLSGTSGIVLANIATAALDLTTGTTHSVGSLSGGGTTGGNVSLTSAAALTIGGDNTSPSAYAGVISGSFATLTKTGTGTQTLSGANTYSGNTTINGGAIVVGADALVNTAGPLGNNGNVVTLSASPGTTSPSIYTGGAFTVSRGITVSVSGTTTGTYSIGGNTDNNSTFSGPIIVNQPLTITQVATTGSNKLTISGGMSTSLTGTKVLTFNNAGSVNVTTNGITATTGNISLTQSGSGTTTLSVANSYTAGTTISAGTLVCGVASAISSTGTITLSGGTLSTGATTGNSQSLGALQLSTNNSTIALGTGSHTLSFSNSSLQTWTSAITINITGWSGTAGAAGTAGRIFVGTTASGLTSTQLSQITFSGYPGTATILSTGEIVPSLVAIKLGVTAVSSPVYAGTAFSVTVQSQDANSNGSPVTSATGISLTNTGGGTIGGNTSTIAINTSSIVVSTVTLNTPATGVTLTASSTSGMSLTTSAASSSFTVYSAIPSVASAVTPSAITTSGTTVSWTNGGGTGRIVVARLTSTAAVVPTVGTTYTPSLAGSFTGSTITGTGNIVVYNGTGTSIAVTNLSSASAYTYDVYEYNGSGSTISYAAAASSVSTSTLAAAPGTAASAVLITAGTITPNGMTTTWTNGNGAGRLVVARLTSTTAVPPTDGTAYTPSVVGSFTGSTTTGTGNIVIFSSTTSTVSVTNLSANNSYTYDVYEYNGSGSTINYTTAASSASTSTLVATPTTTASSVATASVTNTGLTVSWTNGNGTGRIVVARLTATAAVAPTGGTAYTPSLAGSFTGSTITGSGNIVVYNGTGSSIAITNLTAASAYTFDVYEYNGSAPTISYTAATSSTARFTLANPPTAQPGSFAAGSANTAFKATWTTATYPGSGAPNTGYLVIYATGTPALSSANGSAPAASVGTIVNITSGATLTTTVSSLTNGTTYNLLLIPYTWDGTNATTYNYLTASALTATVTPAITSYTWNGGTSGAWSTPSNWTPNTSVAGPTSGDLITFNTGGAVSVTSVPSVTLGSITVSTTNTAVTLSPASTAASTITLTSSGTALSIAAGTTLNLVGNTTNTRNITLAYSGNGTASIAGTLNLQISGSAVGNYTATNSTTTVSGLLTSNNSTSTITSTTSNLIFSGTGKFQLTGTTALAVPTATWQTGSTLQLSQSGSGIITMSGLSGQTFSNLTVDATSTGTINFNNSSSLVSFTVSGDYIQSGTPLIELGGSTGTTNISVGGAFQKTAGTISTTTATTSATITLTNTSGKNLQCNSSGWVNFTVATNAIYTLNGNLAIASSPSAVIVNGTLDCGTYLVSGTASSTFTLAFGATLITANIGGIASTGSTGSIQVGSTRTFNAGANYTYNNIASQSQVTGTGLPTSLTGTVTINNATGVTLSQNTAFTGAGTLSLTSGKLTTNGFTLTLANSTTGSTSSYVVADATGTLTMSGVTTAKTLPIGTSTSYAPLTIVAGSSTNYTAFVTGTLPCAPFDATKAVALAWSINGSTAPSSVVFQWNSGNQGGSFTSNGTCEMGRYNSACPYTITSLGSAAGTNPNTITASSGFSTGTNIYIIGNTNSIILNAPTVTTTIAANSITEAAASSGGQTITGSALSAKGVVWNTSTGPTVALSTLTNDGTSTANFTSSLTSLSPQTLYYTRAYATNAAGTGYGNEVTFRTLSNPVTAQASSFTATATTSNNIDLAWNGATFPGSGATTTGYLLYRATGANTPSFAGVNGAAPVAGSNTTLLTTLASSAVTYSNGSLSNTTTYNYLLIPFTWDGTNAATYNYLTASAPTANATTLVPSTPTFNVGTISSFGAACLTATPQMGSFTVSSASLTGASVSVSSTSSAYTFATSASGPYSNPLDITAYISGSSQNIYVYFAPTTVGADNADITVSGGGVASPSVVSQTGNSGIDTKASFTSATSGSIGSTIATISASLASIGCSAITNYGIKYSTSSSFDPTSAGTTLAGSNLSGNAFSVPITGLSPNQTYYYAAYATNHGGTAYSAVASSTPSFTTATPTISTSGSLSALSTTYGTASATTTFNVSGVDLIAGITITPPIGFEVATTSNFSTTIGTNSSALVVGAAGTVSSTPIYVRLSATANAGSYSGNIGCASSSATTKNVATISSTITAKALTIGGISVPVSKPYDGNTISNITGTPSLLSTIAIGTGLTTDGKPFTGDNVNLVVGSVTGTYNNANVASALTVTIGGVSLTGTAAGNYTLTTTVSATITPLSLTLTASNQSKNYGVTSATTGTLNTNYTISGLISSDAVNVALAYSGSPSGDLATANAGTYTITPSISSFSVGAITNYGTPSIIAGTLTISATIPGTPAITIAPGSQQLTITVTSVSTGGTAITDYLYSTDGGTTYKSAGTASSPIIITTVSTSSSSLANGTQYSVTVKAVNSIGTGAVSNSVNATPVLANSSVNTWITTGNVTAWMTGANWVSGVIPSSTTVAQFDSQSGNSTTAGITFTSDFSILGIELTSNRPRALTIGGTGGSSGPNYYNLTLTGGVIGSTVNTIIRNASSSLLTITPNNSGANYINLVLGNTTNNNINIDGSGGITIASAISGANPLTKGGSGGGVLILSGANTYTGTTTVSAGTLQLNRSGGTTIPVTNSIVINGGTLKISSNQTISNFTMTSGNLIIDAGVTLTISGSYSASGGSITNNGTIALTGISKTFPGNSVTFPTVSVAGQTLATMNSLTINLSSSTNVITWSTPNATMVIAGTLTLTNGLITTTLTNNLSIQNPVTGLTTGSASSYINGPLGIGYFGNSITGTYPIGAGGNYRPVQFSYTGCATCSTSPNIVIIQQNEGAFPALTSAYSTARFGSRYYTVIQSPFSYQYTMNINNNGGTATGTPKAFVWEYDGTQTFKSSANTTANATSTYYGFSFTPTGTTNFYNYVELTETAIPLTIANPVTANKVYDGTTTATVSGATLNGIVNGDNVTLVPAYNFSQSTPGTSLAITSTSSITGANSAAYTLSQPSLTARDITAGTVGSWLGLVSTDYNNVANWQSYSVPLASSNITIPASGITNYPVLSGATTLNNLTINSGTLSLNGQTLTINGAISGSGTITPTATSSLVIGGTAGTINFTSGNNTIKDLTLNSSATATLGGTTNITAGATPGTVTIASGATLNTGGNLVIKSDASGTARIAQSAGSISGNVTVERFITAKPARRFSFVGTPVTQSVRNAWQQQIYVTGPGTGGQPCGTTTGNAGATDKYNSNGFDATLNGSNTIQQYTATLSSKNSRYSGIASTDISLTPGTGYSVNIRGNRNSATVTCDNQLNSLTPTAPEAVTLSASGTVTTGDLTVALNDFATHKFTLLANPYPSQISFAAFKADNASISNKLWTYSPFSSTGAFTTYTKNPVGNGYTLINGATNYDGTSGDFIASGQAFFVQSNANGSVTFSESHKTSGALPNTQYFGSTQVDKSIRLGIYDNLNNRTSEVVLNYSKAGTSWLNDFDAQIFGTAQSLVVYKDSTKLNFAALPDTSINDTVRLGVSIKAGSYSLKFSQLETIDSLQNISLIDNFLGTTTDVRSNPAYSFNVTTDSASKGANRFQIVLSGAVPLAVNFVGINATRNTNGVAVNWSVANEAKIAAYTVERSTDGVYFTTVNNSKATGSSIYTFQDASLPASASILYYRVKATDNLGKASYSNIATVKLSIVNNQLSIFPNPVQRKLNLTIAGATSGSLYSVKITTATGKLAFTKSNVPVSGDAITFDASSFASGVYMIELTDVKGNKLVSKFVKE